MIVSSLEKHIVDQDKWDEAPQEAQNTHKTSTEEGVPSAIGKHPEHGWYVIESSGQGPYLTWAEWWPKKGSVTPDFAFEYGWPSK